MAKTAQAENSQDGKSVVAAAPKAQRISQTVLPVAGFFQSLRVARAIWDELAGDGGRPIEVAAAMGVQPNGGSWKNLTGAAIAFGLTEGGYNALKIKLLPLGRRCVAPEDDGDDKVAMVEAFLKPTLIRSFFQKYDGRKFPSDQIGANVIVGMGYPKDRAPTALSLITADAEKLGLIQTINGEKYVNIFAKNSPPLAPVERTNDLDTDLLPENDDAENVVPILKSQERPVVAAPQVVHRVFITHGKDASIRNQIEELIKFGSFEPVISVKTESLAKPVPLKVLDEMRSCQAAVIHVGIEQQVIDGSGNAVDLVNQNVLIEIGAAMALYRDKFILLVEEGVVLPSNLQGLYECRYSGSELSMTAAMKLLQAFNSFKNK